MTNIKERLEAHYKRAIAHYGEANVLGVFIYGSQNYGTNTENSDVDTKCILIPDLYHLAVKPYDVKHLDVEGEVCECMTIMHMVSNWKKQNINFVEVLFTEYCIINPLFADIWYERFTLENKEAIGRYDMKVAVLSMAYQAKRTIKQDPTNGKNIMNAARIVHSLRRLTETKMGYKSVVWTPDVAHLRNSTFEAGLDDAYVNSLIASCDLFIEAAENGKFNADKDIKENINYFLNDVIIDLIGYRIENLAG